MSSFRSEAHFCFISSVALFSCFVWVYFSFTCSLIPTVMNTKPFIKPQIERVPFFKGILCMQTKQTREISFSNGFYHAGILYLSISFENSTIQVKKKKRFRDRHWFLYKAKYNYASYTSKQLCASKNLLYSAPLLVVKLNKQGPKVESSAFLRMEKEKFMQIYTKQVKSSFLLLLSSEI